MILFLKNLLFTLVMPGTMAGWLPLWIASRAGRAIPGTWSGTHALALIPITLGAAIYFWCLWHFAVDGRATPAPIDAPKALVVRGPYRCVRNPMYLGVSLVILGWAIWFQLTDLLWYLAIWLLFVNLFVLFYEEPTLRRLFGEEYERYCRAVRRWVPGPPYQRAS